MAGVEEALRRISESLWPLNAVPWLPQGYFPLFETQAFQPPWKYDAIRLDPDALMDQRPCVLYELRPSASATAEELIEQFNRKIDFLVRDREGGSKGEDVFVVAANVEH